MISDWHGDLAFGSKPLDLICYCKQHHVTVNCVKSFKPVGCSDGPKDDTWIALYYINVNLTNTTPQLNTIDPIWFYNSRYSTYSRRLFSKSVFIFVGRDVTNLNKNQVTFQGISLNLFVGLVFDTVQFRCFRFCVTYS